MHDDDTEWVDVTDRPQDIDDNAHLRIDGERYQVYRWMPERAGAAKANAPLQDRPLCYFIWSLMDDGSRLTAAGDELTDVDFALMRPNGSHLVDTVEMLKSQIDQD